MKTIVVVFFRRPKPEPGDQQLLAPQTGALAAPANSNDETWVPPFWTWFIENPAPGQS
jgi:hypothetical protein